MIFIGIPVRYHDGDVDPQARKCIDAMINYGQDHDLYDSVECRWGGMSVTQNSFKLIRKFLFDEECKRCTHFLYTGDDLTFPPEGLSQLLAEDRPVIVGTATWKTPPYFVNCSVLNDAGVEAKVYITREMLEKGVVTKVFSAGSGFMLIRRDVLMDVHNFWKDYHKNFAALMPKKYQGFEPVPYFPVTFADDMFVSTDYTFCNAVRACGHDIFLHCGVVVGHIWKKQYSVMDHVNWREAYGMATKITDFPTQLVEPVEYRSVGHSKKETSVGQKAA